MRDDFAEDVNMFIQTLVLRGTEDIALTKQMALEIVEDIGENASFDH